MKLPLLNRKSDKIEEPIVIKAKPTEIQRVGVFSTDVPLNWRNIDDQKANLLSNFNKNNFQKGHPVPVDNQGNRIAMDGLNPEFGLNTFNNNVPFSILSWYSNQGFIGAQLAATFAQHWLIGKCCKMPGDDAIRKGYEITVNSGQEVPEEALDAIRDADVQFNINENLVEYVQFCRIYGIRIAIFKIENDDPLYYEKPFNIDSVTPGSYRGIAQVDPYWITPELDADAAANASSPYFYEPTWWRVSGVRYHRTHLVIARTEQVADVLKPTYLYGGIPIPQKIYERVYAAERTANEAPLLAMTKRTDVLKVDMELAIANQVSITNKIQEWVQFRDNFGIKLLGLNEEMQQFDTSLADLDAVIMTQYQLVAAASNVPVVKLLGTTPKGFNSTGEYEEASYHEMLESIQTHNLTPFLQRHHELLIRSEICPKFNLPVFSTKIVWNPLDAMTAKEKAEVNRDKAETDRLLAETGAIDSSDVRGRIINDPDSGYNGIDAEVPEVQDPFEEHPSGYGKFGENLPAQNPFHDDPEFRNERIQSDPEQKEV